MNIGLKLLLRIIHFFCCDKRNWAWSLKRYLNFEKSEIFGDDNTYYTGLNINHSPDHDEAGLNYITKGGASNFATRYVHPVLYHEELKSQVKKWLNNFNPQRKNSSSITKNKFPFKTV